MNADQHYVYADGSGNRYIITSDSIKFDPVSPEMSSSGRYSGGVARTVSLSAAQYKSISDLFAKAIANKAVHIRDRVKMSGAISVVGGKDAIDVILAPECREQKEIEAFLKKILDGR